MNSKFLTLSLTIPQADLPLLNDLAEKFGWEVGDFQSTETLQASDSCKNTPQKANTEEILDHLCGAWENDADTETMEKAINGIRTSAQ